MLDNMLELLTCFVYADIACFCHFISVGFVGRLCDSVASTVVGKKLNSFTRVSSAVRTAVEEAITSILTPKRSIDVLREAQQARSRCAFSLQLHCSTLIRIGEALQPCLHL